MEYTLENTKDAHYVSLHLNNCDPHQFYKDIDHEGYSYMNSHTKYEYKHQRFSLDKGDLIELSRPHNETKEYWTTVADNGVTKYAQPQCIATWDVESSYIPHGTAQPQGNNMNTSSMIPISYVKSITPLVIGDELSKNGDKPFTIDTDDHCGRFNKAIYNEICSENDFFATKFADRPNTGKQPVADDVVVDLTMIRGGDFDDTNPAVYYWPLDCINQVKTWKPNHAAMLADYKKTQEPKEQRCGDEYPLKTDPDAYMKNDTVIIALCNGDIAKPVFTQAMAEDDLIMTDKAQDNTYGQFIGVGWTDELLVKHGYANTIFTTSMNDDGELPPAGCIAIHIDEGDEVEVLYSSKSFIIYRDKFGKEWNGGRSSFLPIDTRSDKEKAVDAMFVEMNTKMQLRGDHDDYMVMDDTQVGVEFVIEYMEANGLKWVGE